MTLRRAAALLLGATVLLAGCTTAPPDVAAPPVREERPRGVGIQLFQWTWESVAAECENSLSPAGIDWVLVSPAQEHIVGTEWWTSYQPVSYLIESRLGSREQFGDMVARCSAAGVDVVADAVINHMTGQDAPGTGWAGSPFEHYEYPGLYSDADFHHCNLTADDDIADYGSADQVQHCELVNLADLDTSSPGVQSTITGYLEDLLSLGVAGFRIDAAKHMAVEDVAAILDPLPDGTIVVQEVIRGGGEPIQPADYLPTGALFEFDFARGLNDQFSGGLLDAGRLGEGAGLLPTESAVTFVTNHDTERNGETLSYRSGADFLLANQLMLALDYGAPMLYSGYAFSTNDAGPPQDSAGRVLDATCSAEGETYADGDWVCPQRWVGITGMLAWRLAVEGSPTERLWRKAGGYGMQRGDGVFVVNSDDEPLDMDEPTGLAAGAYCDLLSGGIDGDSCLGLTLTVDARGVIVTPIPADTAVALLAGHTTS